MSRADDHDHDHVPPLTPASQAGWPTTGLALLALALFGACADDPALDDVPGDAVDAGIDDARERIDASDQTEAATGVASWRPIACADQAEASCVEALGPDGAVLGTVVASAGTGAEPGIELRLDGLERATLALALAPEQPLHEAAALQGHPFALGYVRDVLERPDPGPTPGALEAIPIAAQRAFLLRMQCIATETYKAGLADACGWRAYGISDDGRTKLWITDQGGTAPLVVVVGMRGTANAADAIQDAKSATWTRYQTVFPGTGAFVPNVNIPRGWQSQWHTQAAKVVAHGRTLNRLLGGFMTSAIVGRRELHLYVVGHSLGAATATVAGYDIAQLYAAFARSYGFRHVVQVYAFNSPRTSTWAFLRSFRQEYIAALAPGGPSLRIRMFQRTGDPVGALPPYAQHAVNQVGNGDRRQGNLDLGYCPFYTGKRLSWLNPVANHALSAWRDELIRMPDSLVACARPFMNF